MPHEKAWAIECRSAKCRYLVFTLDAKATKYGCPHCRNEVTVTGAKSVHELRGVFRSSHDRSEAETKELLRRAVRRLVDRRQALTAAEATQPRTRANSQRHPQSASRVAAYCPSCHHVDIFLRWPGRFKKKAAKGKRLNCEHCLGGSIARIPATGTSRGKKGLVQAAWEFAAARNLPEHDAEQLFAQLSQAAARLRSSQGDGSAEATRGGAPKRKAQSPGHRRAQVKRRARVILKEAEAARRKLAPREERRFGDAG